MECPRPTSGAQRWLTPLSGSSRANGKRSTCDPPRSSPRAPLPRRHLERARVARRAGAAIHPRRPLRSCGAEPPTIDSRRFGLPAPDARASERALSIGERSPRPSGPTAGAGSGARRQSLRRDDSRRSNDGHHGFRARIDVALHHGTLNASLRSTNSVPRSSSCCPAMRPLGRLAATARAARPYRRSHRSPTPGARTFLYYGCSTPIA